MRFTGWDRGIGTLLGAILAGRAKSQDAESLRKILDQQRRRGRTLEDMADIGSGSLPLDMSSDQAGTFGNAPWTSPQDTPYIPNPQFPRAEQSGGFFGSLGDALSTAGRYALEGFTPGNAEAGPLATQVRDARRANERKQNLADAIALAKAKAQNRAPGFTERMYEDYARIHGPKAAMDLWKANQQGGTSDLLAEQLRNNPQAMQDYIKRQTTTSRPPTRLEQLKQEMTDEQYQEYLAGLGGGTPQIKETPLPTGQVRRQGVMPKTGEVKWEQTLPGKPIQAAERKRLSVLRDAYSQMLELEDLITDKKTGKMKDVSGYTGWQGTEPMSSLREKRGLTTEEAAFRNLVKNITMAFVRVNEGAVVPDEMMKRLEAMTPAISNPDASFPVNLQKLKARTEEAFANTLDSAAGAGFDVSEHRLPQSYQEVRDLVQKRNQGGTQQKALRISPQAVPSSAQPLLPRYRITSGVNKGSIVDSKEALMEMIKNGQLSPSDTYEEGR